MHVDIFNRKVMHGWLRNMCFPDDGPEATRNGLFASPRLLPVGITKHDLDNIQHTNEFKMYSLKKSSNKSPKYDPPGETDV